MNVKRNAVVLVDFPFPSGAGSKVRPALVIQNDKDNLRLLNTVVVQITGTTHRSLEPTQVLIEIKNSDGTLSGLRFDSVVNCINIVTLDKSRIRHELGFLPEGLMKKVTEALRIALDFS